MSTIPLQPEKRVARAMAVIVTALMVGLGIAVLAGAAALRHADLAWRQSFAGSWTVEVDSADPAQPTTPERVGQIAALLRQIPGIRDAQPIDPAQVRHLLQPWLGDAAASPDLPLPALIDVRVDPEHRPLAPVVAARLKTSFPEARLDDHSDWTSELGHLARTAEILGLILFAAIGVSAAATIAATARARLAVNRPEIELLHGIGATDAYIVRQFEAGAIQSAVVGSFLGMAVAAAGVYLLFRFGGTFAPLLPQLRLTTTDLAALALVPAATILLVILITRAATIALIRQLP